MRAEASWVSVGRARPDAAHCVAVPRGRALPSWLVLAFSLLALGLPMAWTDLVFLDPVAPARVTGKLLPGAYSTMGRRRSPVAM